MAAASRPRSKSQARASPQRRPAAALGDLMQQRKYSVSGPKGAEFMAYDLIQAGTPLGAL